MNKSLCDISVDYRPWRLRTLTLSAERIPLLMGIVNVTPDSFSDGGRYLDADLAIEHAMQLVADGANILDIGGQSTRPGSEPIPAEEQIRRTEPVIRRLRKLTDVPISIDTDLPSVARSALDAGAQIVNDITGFADPEMMELVAQEGCGVCAMHMQGTPRTMQNRPQYDDVLHEVCDFLAERRDALMQAGVKPDQISLDPGIGFGKTVEDNLKLLGGVARLRELGCPVLIGHSRKRFIGHILHDDSADRDAGTIGVSVALALQGCEILRIHDVRGTCQALQLLAAVVEEG